MNEQEIDSWYEESKEKLVEKYMLALEKKKDHEKAKADFTRKYKAIHFEYEKRMKEIVIMTKLQGKINPAETKWRGIVSFFR